MVTYSKKLLQFSRKPRIFFNELICFSILITPLYLTYFISYLYGYLSYKLTLISIYASFWNIAIALIFSFPRKRILIYAIYILLSLLSLGDIFYISLFKSTIIRSEFYIIYETNFVEIKEFLQDSLKIKTSLILVFIFYCVGFLGLVITCRSARCKMLSYLLLVVVCLMMVTLCVKRARTEALENNIAIKFIQSYISYYKIKAHLKRIASINLEEIVDLEVYPRHSEPEVHVLILGETTSRKHMGLYGYERNTNPRLSKMRDELYIFKDVISPHSHTLPNMRKILTFSNYEKEDLNSKSLIQYVRKAGYKTYWISNQELENTVVDLFAKSSDVVSLVNKKENYIGNKSLDSNVFLPLSVALKEKTKKKFIVIHLLGTHYKYRERYPSSFMKFTSSKRPVKDWSWMVNEYDNAVFYNDYIVSTIISKVKKEGVLSTVLYFSDHGEDVFDVGDFALHTEKLATFPMFTIPFILWISPEYSVANSEKVTGFKKYLDRKYMTDDVIHSIFDLLNIRTPNYRDSKSIFNKQFQYRKRKIGELDFDNEISLIKSMKEYEESEMGFEDYEASIKNRIWVHRVNSKGKLKQAIERFIGVELDVVFLNANNKYDVNHPPQESINLSLDEYLGSISNSNKYSYWFDFKKVIPDEIHASFIKFNELVEKYKLSKNKIVIESKNLTMLKLFKEKGYFTSYYLTKEDAANILNKKKIINESAIGTISLHADHLNSIQQDLEDVKNILLWAPELDIDNKYHRAKIKRILSADRRIKVLLVRLDSKYNR